MTEKEKMLAGLLYDPSDPELLELRLLAHRLCQEYNNTFETDEKRRTEILRELMPELDPQASLTGPIFLDYGRFIRMGEGSFANFNFTCLDCCPVYIGKNVLMGPNVSLLTPLHPLRWQERNPYRKPDGTLTDREYARPITIEDNCWIAGNVTVCGGVTIGEGSVIAAGSVVTRDIPAGVLAAGVPCRPLRPITEADRLEG